MLARVCDICGKKIEKHENVLRVFMGNVNYETGKLEGKITPINEKDLCEECASAEIAKGRSREKTPGKAAEKKEKSG